MNWEKATAVEQLKQKPALFKVGPKQIALFLVDDNVYAIDNRCPHEGYPLTQGQVDENCVLTCAWHNWKFRLEDGHCILGGDHVRAYPTRQEDGHVWIDLSDPPPEQIEAAIVNGLSTAFQDRDFGRICREIARLHYNQLDPLVALRKALEWSHDRFEFGTTHAYATPADWLHLAEQFNNEWEITLVCLAEAVDHIALDALRHREYPYSPPSEEAYTAQAFLDAVEKEQVALAEGLVQRALNDGLHWNDLEETFATAALAHYNDFGHSLIYVYKTGQLLARLGPDMERFAVLPLTRHLCYTTREDLLPMFDEYAETLPAMPATFLTTSSGEASSLFSAGVEEALEWTVKHVTKLSRAELYDRLLLTCAKNLLHFDLAVEQRFTNPVQDNVGWLDFTHGLTFANAVRNLCERYPQLWQRGLLQMACFVGRNSRYLDVDLDVSEWRNLEEATFLKEAKERVLDHGLRDPIFSAHLLKTTLAVEEECASASEECRHEMLAALNRFLHSPIKQKHVRRLARQADDLVKRDFRTS